MGFVSAGAALANPFSKIRVFALFLICAFLMSELSFSPLLFAKMAKPKTAKKTKNTPETSRKIEQIQTNIPRGATLEQLINDALRMSPFIHVEQAKIQEAEALYQYARSQAFPKLTALALVGGPTPETKSGIVNDINSVPESSKRSGLGFGTGELGYTVRTHAEFSIPLYTFEKVQNGKNAAKHLIEAQKHKTDATRADMVLHVTKAFWTYQLTRVFLGSLDEGKKKLQGVLKKIEALLDAESAQVTENDRLRVDYAIRTLDVRKTEAEGARKLAVQALRMLTGHVQSVEFEIDEVELEVPEGSVPVLNDALMMANNQRPELLALSEVVEAQKSFESLRAVSFLPDLFIGGFWDSAYTSNATNQTNPFIYDPYNSLTAGVGLGLRFELDVFTKIALLSQAEAERNTREQELRLLNQGVELEVRKLSMDIEYAKKRVESLDNSNRAARSWLTASALAYDISTGRADELIDAFLAWAASEAELEKTRFDLLIALTDLSRASGTLLQKYRAKSN